MSDEANKPNKPSITMEELVMMLRGQEGVARFNALREEYPAWEPVFPEGTDFQAANLSGVKLNGAFLVGVNLSGANLSHAWLIGADLSEADLYDANLSHAGLEGADFSEANLSRANFAEADTDAVQWWCANIAGAEGMRPEDVEIVLATIRRSVSCVPSSGGLATT